MKLANYISLRFIGWAMLLLVLSIPVFYFSLEYVILSNEDEYLENQKIWIENQKNIDLLSLPKFNGNIEVTPIQKSIPEKFYIKNIFNTYEQEVIKTRILEFSVNENGTLYQVKIHRSLVEFDDILKTIVLLQISLLVFMAIALFIINKNLEKKVWNPFYSLLQKLKKYRIDQHQEIEFKDSKIFEMQSLNQSIEDLVQRNQRQFLAQKEFTENASHELQTPLSIVQNKVELLMQTENLSEEQSKILADIYETNAKLSKLNKSLLLLSKLDNQQFTSKNKLFLKPILEKSIADFQGIAEEKNVTFQSNLSEKQLIADENLVRILIGNLLSNAVKFSSTSSEIHVELAQNYLRISNASTSEKLNEKLLFKRFQKQNSDNSSNGLGLEISKKICEVYAWKISYYFDKNQHIFEILF